MKKILWIALLCLTLPAAAALAHHPAADIVDADIYAIIDEMVSDTPHADLTFSDMGGGTTTLAITSDTLRSVENLIDDGLLTYASMLDGDVTVEISFGEKGGVVLTIVQGEDSQQ